MQNWLASQSGLSVFTAVVVIVAAAITLWRLRRGRPGVMVWVAAAALIIFANVHVDRAVDTESDRIARELLAPASICAAEFRALGHDFVTVDSAPDAPEYLAMIAAEKRWLAANPGIADIYTLRPISDTRWATIVDSETDFDHDGRFTGMRESRVPIGEELADDPAFSAAWYSGSGFSARPANIRWGRLVSAAAPILDASGAVEAVLVLDYPAERWDAAIAGARLAALRGDSILGVMALITIVGYLATRDALTDRKRVAESLRRTQLDLSRARESNERAARVKTDFLGTLAREMRGPVVGMLSTLEAAESPQPAERLRSAAAQGRQLLDLLDNLAELSRLESGRLIVETADCSPIEVVRDVESTMRPIASAGGVHFGVEFAGRVPAFIHTDPVRLKQALVSVCRHAVAASQGGDAKLVVSFASGSAAAMQFDIVDSGPGLTPDQAADLLRPLAQASAITGAGGRLNLCVALHLARMMGGDLRIVESKPGVGTRIRLIVDAGAFGAKLVEATSKIPTASKLLSPRPHAGRRVLIAGDGPDRGRQFRYVLARAGFEIIVVDNGRAAIDAAISADKEGRRFDVLLVDVEMPVIDGYGAARSLRRDGYKGSIVALASNPAANESENAASAGCDEMLVKPVDQKLLVDTVTRLAGAEITPATV